MPAGIKTCLKRVRKDSLSKSLKCLNVDEVQYILRTTLQMYAFNQQKIYIFHPPAPFFQENQEALLVSRVFCSIFPSQNWVTHCHKRIKKFLLTFEKTKLMLKK